VDDKLSWLRGWASLWQPPQTNSCHKFEEDKDNDLLVHCMSDSTTDIFKKR
jgi:hypothetical protein